MTAEQEMEAVSAMLERAAEYDLETEVVLELYRAVRADPNIDLSTAISVALREWDIL